MKSLSWQLGHAIGCTTLAVLVLPFSWQFALGVAFTGWVGYFDHRYGTDG